MWNAAKMPQLLNEIVRCLKMKEKYILETSENSNETINYKVTQNIAHHSVEARFHVLISPLMFQRIRSSNKFMKLLRRDMTEVLVGLSNISKDPKLK